MGLARAMSSTSVLPGPVVIGSHICGGEFKFANKAGWWARNGNHFWPTSRMRRLSSSPYAGDGEAPISAPVIG